MQKKEVLFYVRVSGILLLICALVAVLLAGVNQLTKDTIAAHKAEKVNNAIGAIFADSTATETDLPEGHALVTAVYIVTIDETTVGYCYTVTPNGFGGALELMVGVSPAGKVCGVEVIDHSETSGIGSNVLTSTYLARYLGKAGTLTLGEDVDALTGATVSSKAVLAGVNAALAAHADVVKGA